MKCVYIFLLFCIYQVHEKHLASSKSVHYSHLNYALAKRSLRQVFSTPELSHDSSGQASSQNNLLNFFRNRRSISNAVVETANCEHEHLVGCEDYDSDEKKCWITYGGMRCCICTGRLKMLRTRKWLLW